ncbi:hypothetical protein HPC49_12160 [Pyxidicoccus fallax]|uniref:Glycosyltransferase n=1 Tax=Pyxidicoccus fallax TaxID=394095 RepID=A0A848LJT1_9BACT|nr:hypothetical protein [Pyxidicoccus fallax]NMO17962.1 hypothetical protein [Pyxidicoccus fallax]NPC78993.1 hypothetical protein [Pyxidicoccus fallax]
MSQPRRVCLVLEELYPFTAGGIARLAYNFIQDSDRRGANVEFHIAWAGSRPLTTEEAQGVLGPRAFVHTVDVHGGDAPTFRARKLYPPRWAYPNSDFQAQSLRLMLELERLSAEVGAFDVIEFPDFRGWAWCSLQEKRLRGLFRDTVLAVRMHGTAGVIEHVEGASLDSYDHGRLEIERKALLDADLVVGHIDRVVTLYQQFYGFDEDWRRRALTQLPPAVLVDEPAAPVLPHWDAPVVFATKLQRCKRPDLFVSGMVHFMDTTPEYRGKAVVACHSFSPEYEARLRALVPSQLVDRFEWRSPKEGREQLCAPGNVWVIASDFEAFNLTAYEANAAGATVVLNGMAAAFGEDSPFVDGVNCFKFGGTPESLARVLTRVFVEPLREPVRLDIAIPYWEEARASTPRPVAVREGSRPRITVAVAPQANGEALLQTLKSVIAEAPVPLELVIADSGYVPADGRELWAGALAHALRPHPVRTIPFAGGSLAAFHNEVVATSIGDDVAFVGRGATLSRGFLQRAVEALEQSPDYGWVVPTVGFSANPAQAWTDGCEDYETFMGDVPSLGLTRNRLSGHTFVARRSVLGTRPFRDVPGLDAVWDLALRRAHEGVRFLVTSAVEVILPPDAERLTRLPTGDARAMLAALWNGVAPRHHPGTRLHMVGVLLSAPSPAPEAAAAPSFNVADKANALLKRFPRTHQLAKSLVQTVYTPEDGRPLRHELVRHGRDVLLALKRLSGAPRP